MSTQCLKYLLIILINVYLSKQSFVLHIGALFDFDHPLIDNGQRDLQAAELAINEINRQNQELFDGLYTLKLLTNNTQVYISMRRRIILNRFFFVYYIVYLVQSDQSCRRIFSYDLSSSSNTFSCWNILFS